MPPVVYHVYVTHHEDGEVDVLVKDIDCEKSDREKVAAALRKAADQVAGWTPKRVQFN